MNSSSEIKLYTPIIPRELAAIPGFLSVAILVANILILVTFSRMKTLKLQHYFMCVLAVNDLLTISTLLPSIIGICQGYVCLSDDHCKLIAILSHIFVAITDWLHCVICVERSYSILRPLDHRTLLIKYKPKSLAIKLSGVMILIVMTTIIALSYTNVLTPTFDTSFGMCLYAIDWQYFTSMGVLFCIVPLVIEVVTHLLILMKIKKSGIQGRKRIVKVIRAVKLTVGAYYACCGPFFIWVIWKLTPAKSHHQNVSGFLVMCDQQYDEHNNLHTQY